MFLYPKFYHSEPLLSGPRAPKMQFPCLPWVALGFLPTAEHIPDSSIMHHLPACSAPRQAAFKEKQPRGAHEEQPTGALEADGGSV